MSPAASERGPRREPAAKLVTGSVRRHLIAQTTPMLLGIGATMSVGIVDAYFVGQLGPDALAAIGFIFPLHVALQSLGVGVMVGINSVAARALGGQDQALAERRGFQGVALALVLGLALGGALLALRTPIFRALGARVELLPLVDAYIVPYALAFPLLVVTMGMNGVLRAQGLALRSSSILFAVAIVNWILDPVLIAGWGPWPAFGLAGAAYATGGAFLAAAAGALCFVQTSGCPLRLRHLSAPDWRLGIRQLGRVGGPAAFSNAINPFGLTLLTGLLARHGEDAVAAFGAAGRVQSLAVVPLLALSSSIGPVVAQNWGARAYDRARAGYRDALLFCLLFGGGAAGLLIGLRDRVGAAFSDDPRILDAFSDYFLVSAWGLAGFGILVVTNGALNAVDRAGAALRLSLVRVAAVMVPLAWLGSALFGPIGIYGGVLAANVFGAAAGLWVGRRALS